MAEAAAKDSSMEDILASIRRIINTDTAKKEAGAETAGSSESTPSQPGRTPEIKQDAPGSLSALASKMRGQSPDKPAPAVKAEPVVDAEPATPVSSGNVPTTTTASSASSAPQVQAPKPMASQPVPNTAQAPSNSLAALAQSVRNDKAPEADARKEPVGDNPQKAAVTPNEPKAPSSDTGGVSLSDLAARVAASESQRSENNATEKAPMTVEAGAPEAKKPAEPIHQKKSEEAPPSATSTQSAQDSVLGRTESKAPQTAVAEKAEPAAKTAVAKQPEPEKSPGADTSSVAAKETVSVITAKPRSSSNETDSPEDFREALVAPSTSAAVAGSMDRLRKAAEDVDNAQVEAVLRPMLKQWLDDNLPGLVERLVQEEIKRITRGK